MTVRQIVISSVYTHPVIGCIKVRVVATARSIRAHWEGAVLHISVPKGLDVRTYDNFVENNIVRLLELKPECRFSIGQVIDGGEVDFLIEEGNLPGGRENTMMIRVSTENLRPGKKFNICITLSPAMAADINAPAVQTHINKVLIKMAGKAVSELVIPRAQELAREVGVHPREWFVKNKKRSLGTCDGSKRICLSPKLIFLPEQLRDFVILHELAHLTEMNHSSAFHALCNKYCGGNEQSLQAALKAFTFPVD